MNWSDQRTAVAIGGVPAHQPERLKPESLPLDELDDELDEDQEESDELSIVLELPQLDCQLASRCRRACSSAIFFSI